MTVSDLGLMVRALCPVLHDEPVAFCVATSDAVPPDAIVAVREPEGLTLVVPAAVAERLGLDVRFRAAWITLSVHSDLAAVGLTAAVSGALAAAGIACNVVAGVYHDHLFVPEADGPCALACLDALQRAALQPDAA